MRTRTHTHTCGTREGTRPWRNPTAVGRPDRATSTEGGPAWKPFSLLIKVITSQQRRE